MSSTSLEAPDINPVVIYIPVPLIVLERCENTYQLAVWIALRWLLAAYPDATGFSYYQIGKRAGVDREEIARLLSELLELELIVIAGTGKVLRAPGERQRYSIDLKELLQLSVSSVYDVLTRWRVRRAKPQPKEQQQLQLDDMTSGNGITSQPSTSGNGITSQNQFLAVKPPDVLDSVINLPVPVVVLERCNPSQMCTWISMYWWKQALPRGRRPTNVQTATRGMVSRGRVRIYQHQLFELGLSVIIGHDGTHDIYSISDYEINQLLAGELPKILAIWRIEKRPHRTTNEEQLMFFATPATSGNGITSHAVTSGNGITSQPSTSGNGVIVQGATSGYRITQHSPLKEKKSRKRKDDSIVLDSFETPDGEPILPAHPLQRWRDLNPDTSTADLHRLQRYARQHDAPVGGYVGGYGWYWVGRAIEAAYTARHGEVSLEYIHAILSSWRRRTTTDVSAYGSDAPGYRRRSASHPAQSQPEAPASMQPTEVPAELVALWQRILGQFQARLDRAVFDTWLRETTLLDVDDGVAVIAASNVFARDRIERDYADDIATGLAAELDRPVQIKIVIGGSHAA